MKTIYYKEEYFENEETGYNRTDTKIKLESVHGYRFTVKHTEENNGEQYLYIKNTTLNEVLYIRNTFYSEDSVHIIPYEWQILEVLIYISKYIDIYPFVTIGNATRNTETQPKYWR